MAIVTVNGMPVGTAIETFANTVREYCGYSSDRLLRYDAVRGFHRQHRRGTLIKLEVESLDGTRKLVEVAATLEAGYVPRLPTPVEGVNDSADLTFKRLDHGIGYIYVRRIPQNLIELLDRAVGELHDCGGLILDVRGNSGGGFDAERAFRNFDPDDQAEPQRPRFLRPVAVLIDARTISAGEGWSSWFHAKHRAKFFGETTAGASARKTTVAVADGLFQVMYPIKAYTGFLDRPIERLGIAPDVPVRPSAKDLAQGVDSVLETAKRSLMDAAVPTSPAQR
jgi:C-terminal processing protease CtpA/Prc